MVWSILVERKISSLTTAVLKVASNVRIVWLLLGAGRALGTGSTLGEYHRTAVQQRAWKKPCRADAVTELYTIGPQCFPSRFSLLSARKQTRSEAASRTCSPPCSHPSWISSTNIKQERPLTSLSSWQTKYSETRCYSHGDSPSPARARTSSLPNAGIALRLHLWKHEAVHTDCNITCCH